MPIFSRSSATERGLARFIQRSSPQAGELFDLSAEPQPSATLVLEKREASTTPSSVPVVSPLPDSVKALAGIITVLGVVVLGIAIWKIRAWRLKRRTPASSEGSLEKRPPILKSTFVDLEKGESRYPEKAVLFPLVPATPELGTGWVPQIRSRGPDPSIAGPPPAKKRQSRCPRIKSKFKTLSLVGSKSGSPPPYIVESGKAPPVPTQPAIHIPSNQLPRALPAPPAFHSSDHRVLERRNSPPSLTLEKVPHPQSVPAPIIASPMRTVSNRPSERSSGRARSNDSSPTKKLPRLVMVVMTYTPSKEDELPIKVGDTLRLLEEYEDEWCSVQRVGRHDDEKGVIPCFCVVDRPEVIPSHQKTPSLTRPTLTSFATSSSRNVVSK